MSPRPLFALAIVLATAPAARAQQPPPTPPVITSQLRERLRTEILRTIRADGKGSHQSNTRPDLALPIAQLGDWKTALRWTSKENDSNSNSNTNELWHWRATQLARAGKWSEVAPAAAHLSPPDLRADPLLFAARQMLERGVRLNMPNAESRQLGELLNAAAPLLTNASPAQQSYRAYLYAQGGDVAASRRIFARVMPQAERADVRAVAEAKAKSEPIGFFTANDVRSVLEWQVASGLLSDSLSYGKNHLDNVDENSLSWWIAGARNESELQSLSELVAQLPNYKRLLSLYFLSIRNANLGYQDRALNQFKQARQLADEELANIKPNKSRTPEQQSDDALNMRARLTYPAFLTAIAIKDDELIAQTKAEQLEIAAALPEKSGFSAPNEIPLTGIVSELTNPEMMSGKPLATPRLLEISEQLRAAPASELQFRALETLATHFYLRKNNGELLKAAQTMLATARALQKSEQAKRAGKEDSLFSPYWPNSPRVLTAIFWLQRAGDAATAAQFARGFAQNVPARERPYAAMLLTQLGFFDLADKVFDPAVEIPISQKRERARMREYERTGKFNVDWSEFSSWGDFAATQAQFRAPDAPFRWIGKIETPGNRANVLSAWTAALFPVAPLRSPYVTRTPNGGGSQISGYSGGI